MLVFSFGSKLVFLCGRFENSIGRVRPYFNISQIEFKPGSPCGGWYAWSLWILITFYTNHSASFGWLIEDKSLKLEKNLVIQPKIDWNFDKSYSPICRTPQSGSQKWGSRRLRQQFLLNPRPTAGRLPFPEPGGTVTNMLLEDSILLLTKWAEEDDPLLWRPPFWKLLAILLNWSFFIWRDIEVAVVEPLPGTPLRFFMEFWPTMDELS